MDLPTEWIKDLQSAWKRENPSRDASNLFLVALLGRLGHMTEVFRREVLEPSELTGVDDAVLSALRRAGPPHTLSPSDLYSGLDRSSGGITRVLKRLEQRGLVRRSPDPKDGRGTLVTLTKEGQALHAETFEAYLDAGASLFESLTKRERKEIAGVLGRLLEVFEEHLYR